MDLFDKGKRGSLHFVTKFCDHGENPIRKRCKIIRSDSGLEFLSEHIKQFYLQKGKIHHTSCVETQKKKEELKENIGMS